ncbi:endonuclease V [Halolamina rubra]|uniref:endonuclease V n=1 Tax=Halolamina rubra TaxID=1380430 RepID=UPI000ABE80DE|nr:endonuclease V [Halolamina rubra]
MLLARPEFRPDPALSRAEMESLQREIADAATFADDLPFDPDAVGVDDPVEADASGTERLGANSDAPVIVGVDQAFLDERAVSAIVAVQDGAVIERTHAVTPLSIPYVPGLLAFREGGPILAAFEELSVEPDLAVFDGSGRIHFRQAGIATHVGVALDLPSVGVAKRLLCGEPVEPVDDRPAGWSTPIEAGPDVEAPEWTTIGHAYQSRQWDRDQSINPLYVSPGHRVSAATTRDLVDALSAGYKLPEPTRLADRYADDAKAEYE